MTERTKYMQCIVNMVSDTRKLCKKRSWTNIVLEVGFCQTKPRVNNRNRCYIAKKYPHYSMVRACGDWGVYFQSCGACVFPATADTVHTWPHLADVRLNLGDELWIFSVSIFFMNWTITKCDGVGISNLSNLSEFIQERF